MALVHIAGNQVCTSPLMELSAHLQPNWHRAIIQCIPKFWLNRFTKINTII